MDLLTMCPTKSRAKRIHRMIDSFLATSGEKTKLVIYISDDDPQIEDYHTVINQYKEMPKDKLEFFIDKNRNLVEIMNYFSTEVYPDIQYYQEINDDHVYKVPKWDEIMIAEAKKKDDWAIVWCATEHNLPGGALITGKVVRTLGFFLPPTLSHLYTDNYMLDLGTETDLIVQIPSLLIEHEHPCFGKAEQDATYEAVYSHENWVRGKAEWGQWNSQFKSEHIQKILEARFNEIRNR